MVSKDLNQQANEQTAKCTNDDGEQALIDTQCLHLFR